MRFLIVAIALSLVRSAAADRIPSGKEWFCYEGKTGQCRRLSDECESTRDQLEPEDGERTANCKRQKQAAVVTFRIVLKDQRRYFAGATFAACKEFRSFLLEAGEDYAEVSSCTAAGERRWKLNAKVPKGEAFYCAAFVIGRNLGGLYDEVCYRSLKQCSTRLSELRARSPESSPLEVLLDCERRHVVYGVKANDASINLRPSWCEDCHLVW